jgi:hypothetical protein
MSQLVVSAPARSRTHTMVVARVPTIIGGGWGWLPMVTLISALGLVIVAAGFTASRAEVSWAMPLFWVGYLTVMVPPIVRIAIGTASRAEALGTLLVFGMGIYLVKVLYSPLWFSMGDETQHWRTTLEILQTGQLFTRNPILHVSPYYPGLENPTTALISLTGVSIFHGGTIVVGVARALLVLGLYHLFDLATRSRRIASIATLVYMLGPQFLIFDAQFAYGSLALGITAVVLFCLLEHTTTSRTEPAHLVATLGIACAGILAITVTHHISSYVLAAFLALWTAVTYFRKDWSRQRSALGWCALIGVIAGLGWLALIATITIPYLGQPIIGSVQKTIALVSGESRPRQLFAPVAGQAIPLWIRLSGFASGGFVLLALPVGWWFTFRKFKRNALAMAMLIFSLAHPIIQVIRLTPDGLTTGGRALSYVFWAVGFVVAVGFVHQFENSRWRGWWKTAFVGWAATITFGSMAAILSVWRLPGGFDGDSYMRFIQAESISAAEWARLHLGPENVFGGDDVNGITMGSYGDQNALGPQDDIYVQQVVLNAPALEHEQLQYLKNIGVEYLTFDTRVQAMQFPDKRVQNVLDTSPLFDRIFDSGHISIYDARRMKQWESWRTYAP